MDPARNQAIAGQRAVLNRDQYVALLRAKETSMTSSDWRPISEAPKDGTDVHVMRTDWLCPVPAYYISRSYLQEAYGDPEYMEEGWYPSGVFPFDVPEVVIDPTHWLQLPPPPEIS